MSRKVIHTTEATPHASPKLSAFDVGHVHSRNEYRNSPGKHPGARSLKTSVQVGAQSAAQTEGSDGSEASAADTDAEDSDDESAKADDESSDAEDPDAIAPPCAMDGDGHQAGPTLSTTASNLHVSPSKGSQSANSQAESSDDEVYDGIDLISDSERDGSDMDHLEARAIVDSEDNDDTTHNAAPRNTRAAPSPVHDFYDFSDDTWGGLDFDQGAFGESSDFFDQQLDQTDIYNLLSTSDYNDFSGFPSEIPLNTDDLPKSPSLPSQRRVRFADPPHSEIQGFDPYPDDVIGMFEDAKQEPTFSSGSVWDNHSDNDSDSSSGYESDYGETTDEDEFPASATARPQALVRRPSVSSTKVSSPNTPTPARKPGQPYGPRLGSWFIDPTKPLAIVDTCGKRLLVCPARRPAKPDRVFEHLTGSGSTTANTSPRTPSSKLAIVPNDSDVELSDLSSQGMVSPMFGPPSALDNVLSGKNFFASNSVYPEYRDADTMYSNMEYDDIYDDDDKYEDAIKMEDLFNLTSDDNDSEPEAEEPRPSSSGDDVPTTGQSSQNLLGHLDTGVVSAFRENQHRHDQEQQDILQPRSPLRKRKASPLLPSASRRKITT